MTMTEREEKILLRIARLLLKVVVDCLEERSKKVSS